jgi:hypothetical protein
MNSCERQATVSLIGVVVRIRRRYSRHLPSCGCCSTFGSSSGGSSVGITSQRRPHGKPSQLVLPTPIIRDHWPQPAPRDGFFRVVYRFENEQLVELINRTAHAAALSALVETATAYRFYLAVYVCRVSRFTPFYMAVIDPFRKLIVYPSLLRSVRARWNQAFGTS